MKVVRLALSLPGRMSTSHTSSHRQVQPGAGQVQLREGRMALQVAAGRKVQLGQQELAASGVAQQQQRLQLVLMVVGSTVVVGLVATAGLVLEGVGASLSQPPVLPWGLASSVSNLGTGPATAPTADAPHSVTCVSICE
jgi:hypothetical protein